MASKSFVMSAYASSDSSVPCSFPALVRAKGRPAFLAVGSPLCVLLPTFELSLKVCKNTCMQLIRRQVGGTKH